jgi:hypothetical protein
MSSEALTETTKDSCSLETESPEGRNDEAWLAPPELYPRPSFAMRLECLITLVTGWPEDLKKYSDYSDGGCEPYREILQCLLRTVCCKQSLPELAIAALGEGHHLKLWWHLLSSLLSVMWNQTFRWRACKNSRNHVQAQKNGSLAKQSEKSADSSLGVGGGDNTCLALLSRTEALAKHKNKAPITKEVLRQFLEDVMLADYDLDLAVVDNSALTSGILALFEDMGHYFSEVVSISMSHNTSISDADLKLLGWIVASLAPAAWELGLQTPDVIVTLVWFAKERERYFENRHPTTLGGVVQSYVNEIGMESRKLKVIKRKLSVDLCDIIPAVASSSHMQGRLAKVVTDRFRLYGFSDRISLRLPSLTLRMEDYDDWMGRLIDIGNLLHSIRNSSHGGEAHVGKTWGGPGKTVNASRLQSCTLDRAAQGSSCCLM